MRILVHLYSYLIKFQLNKRVLAFVFFSFLGFSQAFASYTPLNTSASGNIGIGSVAPSGKLDVEGTFSTIFNATAAATGNVGIGSFTPGQRLDVQGTVRAMGFNMGTNSPASGYVLTASDSAGDATWTPAGSVGPWTQVGANVYTTGNNVGVGTTTPQGAFVVTNGNVGIGTWAPKATLDVEGTQSLAFFNGNVGIGTSLPSEVLSVGTNQLNIRLQSGGAFVGPEAAGTGGTWGFGMIGTDISYAIRTGIRNSGDDVIIRNNNGNGYDFKNSIGFIANSNNYMGWASSTDAAGTVDTNLSRYSAGVITVGTGTLGSSAGTLVANNIGIGSIAPKGALDVEGTVPVVFNALAASTGNVGIGSYTPGQRLDVQGTVRALGFNMGTNGPASGYVLTASDSAGNATWTAAGSVGPWTQVGTNIYATGNNVGVGTTTPQGAFVVTNGNVGIGTWAPGAALDVFGTLRHIYISQFGNLGIGSIAPNSILDLKTTGANSDIITFNNGYVGQLSGTGSLWIVNQNSTAAGTLNFGTNNIQRAIIDLNGNVGIGTSTPQTGLAVMNGNVGIGTWTAAGGNLIVNGGGNVGIGTAWPGQVMDVQGTVRALGFAMGTNGPASGYVLTASDSFGDATWTAAGSVGPWTQTGSFIYETSNNIGIGSAAPGAQLDVNGTARVTGFTMTGQGAAAGNVLVGNAVGVGTWMAGSTVAGSVNGLTTNYLPKALSSTQLTNSLIFDNGSNVGIGSANPTAALDINGGLSTGGSGDSYFSSGNLGIGSTAPGTALDVQGTVRDFGELLLSNPAPQSTTNLLYNNAGTLYFNGSAVGGASGWSTGTGTVYTTTGSNNVGIGTSTPQGGLVVTNGNVGIGTWAPVASLDVEGTVKYGAVFPFSNVGIGTTTPQGSLVVTAGNVGIGTWVPVVKLHVIGNVGIGDGSASAVSSAQSVFYVAGGTSTTYANLNTGGTGFGINAYQVSGDQWEGFRRYVDLVAYGGNKTTNMRFYTNDVTSNIASRMILMGTGNLGIGTFTGQPLSSRLVVSGNMGIGTNASSAYVTVNSPPAGGMIVEGNVGIGSFAPGTILDVQGTVRDFGELLLSNPAPQSTTNLLYNNAGTLYFNGSAVGGASGWSTGTGTIYNTTGSDKVGIGTSTPQGGLVVTNGNVGIGTWAPRGTLDVEGTVSVATFAGNVGIGSLTPGSTLDITTPTAAPSLPAFRVLTSGTSYFSVAQWGYTNIRVAGDTVAPYNASLNLNTANDTSVGIAVRGNSASQTSDLQDWQNSSGTNLALINAAGNLGVGTVAPSGKLDVEGTFPTVFNAVSGSTNNVGIGTFHPGVQLDVQGTVRAVSIGFMSEVNNGTCSGGGTVTVNWNAGNKQMVTIGAPACTIAFSGPTAMSNSLLLRVVQDATGGRTVGTWPASVRWTGGSAPTLTSTALYSDIVSCYYNGSLYYCGATLNFSN